MFKCIKEHKSSWTISPALHRPGQVQYFQRRALRLIPTCKERDAGSVMGSGDSHRYDQFCMDLHSKDINADCKPAKLTRTVHTGQARSATLASRST